VAAAALKYSATATNFQLSPLATCHLPFATRYGGDGGIGGTFPLMVVLVVLKRLVVFIRTQSSVPVSRLATGHLLLVTCHSVWW
jgi:hypothetical protein